MPQGTLDTERSQGTEGQIPERVWTKIFTTVYYIEYDVLTREKRGFHHREQLDGTVPQP